MRASEAGLLSTGGTRPRQGHAGPDGDSSNALGDGAFRDAVLSEAFQASEADVNEMDLCSVEGRIAAIERSFAAGCALITRTLLWGQKDLGRRHPYLAKLLELSKGRLFV